MLRKVCALGFAFAVAALGRAQNYANNPTVVNCGVVVLSNDAPTTALTWQPFSAAPFAFYNLDAATNVKPAGWSFQNPLAPGQVSASVAQQWVNIQTETNSVFPVPNAGDSVSKRNAAYWSVDLDTMSATDISRFNLLLIAPSQFLSVTPYEREMLRLFVDGGGILWIDTGALPPAANSVDQLNSGPINFSLSNTGGGSSTINVDLTQPILTSPYPLTLSDISLLDSHSTAFLTGSAITLGAMSGSAPGDIFTLQPYANNGSNYPTEMLTRIGDGFVVVTARGAALELNRPAAVSSYSANTAYYALDNGVAPILGPDGIVAAKLVINMVSLQTEGRMAQQGTRKSNSVGVDLSPPLLQRFNNENGGLAAPLLGVFPTATPVFYKNLMFVTAGNWLYAYDVYPPENLDGTGNPDDGIVDYSVGAPYDLVWQAQIPGAVRLSSPVCTEVAHASGVPRDQVWVADDQGNLWMFNALPTNANGIGFGGNLTNETNTFYVKLPAPGGPANYLASEMPIGPTIHDGYVYAADTQNSTLGNARSGRVWIADTRSASYVVTASQGNQPWVVGGASAASQPGAAPLIGDISGSPVVGSIPIADNSGGTDLVIYVPVRPSTTPTNQPAGVTSIWLGARGEVPAAQPTTNGDSLQVQTRASNANGNTGIATYTDASPEAGENGAPDPRTIKLTVIQNGAPWSEALMTSYFNGSVSDNGSGTLTFGMKQGQGAAFQTLLNSTINPVSVRVDYMLDWGRSNAITNLTNSIVRGSFPFLDTGVANNITIAPVRQVIGNLALSPRGTLYAVVADPNGTNGGELGGSFYELRESYRGNFNVIVRYDLYPQHGIVLNQALPISYDEVLYDKDPINQFVNTADWVSQRSQRAMSNFVFTGGPTVRNGEVFVSAQATKNFILAGGPTIPNVPVTILMAFAAEPLAPEIPVGAIPPGASIQLQQPDFAQSNPANLSNPNATSSVGSTSQGTNTSNTTGTQAITGFNYDPISGYITFSSLADQTQGLTNVRNCLSLSQPVILHLQGTPDRLIDPSALTNRWSPLLWYQVFQGNANAYGSGPVITGDSVFLGMSSAVPGILSNPNETTLAVQGLVNATTAQIPPNSPWLQAQDWKDGPNGDYRSWQLQLWTLPSPFAGGFGTPAPGTGVDPFIVWPQISGVQTLQDYATRLNQTTLSHSFTTYAIAAGENALAAVGNLGMYVFDRGQFLVCDEGRLARFDSSGNPIQIDQGQVSGGSNDSSNGGVYQPLVRPTRAYDLDNFSSLVVDQGGDRIVKIDRSNNVLRSISTFQYDQNYGNPTSNPLYANVWPQEAGFLNESNHLKSPSDVVTYSGYTVLAGAQSTQQVTDQQAIEYWVHYVIADQGNNRLVELVDRYSVDPTTLNVGPPIELSQNLILDDGMLDTEAVPQLAVCLWHSPAAQSGRGYSYNSINRVWIPAGNGFPGRYVYVAGVGNAATVYDQNIGQSNVTNPSPIVPNGAPGSNGVGGIVIFDNAAPNFAQVYNAMTGLPNLTNTPFWDFGQGQWDTVTPLNVTNQAAGGGSTSVPFNNVNSVTAKVYAPYANGQYGAPVIQIMVADADGVFEVSYTPDGEQPQPVPGALPVDWYLPDQVYCSLRNVGVNSPLSSGNPNALNATYAKRLDNGDVLLVNGYAGTFYPLNSGAFNGEVIELNGQTQTNPGFGYNYNNPNLGFGLSSINYVLGPIQKVRGILLPSFADRR